ncbi:MAG: dipicolinate synthase, partial [Oscillospiraceae bacterium]|nr:dipicolinate synthase [Oscillospiraceae bacterium]
MRFAIVGGDRRAALLAELLLRDGHRVHSFALEEAALPAEIPREACLQSCVYGADCVVLPVPAEASGFLNAPLS